MTPPVTTRKTAQERREEILDSALTEFAARGFDGASTDAIARRVGISQPYLFRLFGTKKELFLAATERCFADTLHRFTAASEGLEGEAALAAMGAAYGRMITEDPRRLRAQMQAYAACGDPEIRAAVQRGFGALVGHAEGLGLSPERVTEFFATGMLINVIVAMDLPHAHAPWSERLVTCVSTP